MRRRPTPAPAPFVQLLGAPPNSRRSLRQGSPRSHGEASDRDPRAVTAKPPTSWGFFVGLFDHDLNLMDRNKPPDARTQTIRAVAPPPRSAVVRAGSGFGTGSPRVDSPERRRRPAGSPVHARAR